jgi:hypothetical protein
MFDTLFKSLNFKLYCYIIKRNDEPVNRVYKKSLLKKNILQNLRKLSVGLSSLKRLV